MQSDLFGLSAVIAEGQMLMFENTPDDAGSVKFVQLNPPTRGDLTCDGMVDTRDIWPLISVLLDSVSPTPKCNAAVGNVDGDGRIDGRDVLRLVEKMLYDNSVR